MAKKGGFTAKNAAEEFMTKLDIPETVAAPLSKDSENQTVTVNPPTNRQTRPSIKRGGFVQRAYYISNDVFKKIKFLAVEQERDASSIVREALDEYLKGK